MHQFDRSIYVVCCSQQTATLYIIHLQDATTVERAIKQFYFLVN